MILFLVVMDGAAFEFFSHLVQVELRRTINCMELDVVILVREVLLAQ
jgi:hypothetical protein